MRMPRRGDGPPRARTPNRRGAAIAAHAIIAVHSAAMAHRTESTRTGSRCHVHCHREQHQSGRSPQRQSSGSDELLLATVDVAPRSARTVRSNSAIIFNSSRRHVPEAARGPRRRRERDSQDRCLRPRQVPPFAASDASPSPTSGSATLPASNRTSASATCVASLVPADHARTTTGHDGAISPIPAITPARHPRSAPTRTPIIASAVTRTSNSACSASSALRLASDPWSRAMRVLPSHHTAMAAASARPVIASRR